jgi:signal transduction histidine kinase
VRLELVNDGAGAHRTDGSGLQNLADRLAEVDGRAAIRIARQSGWI